VVCWAAHLGWLHLAGTPLAFLGHPATLFLFTLLALGELVSDKLPKTPARTAPVGLIARILMGGLCGAALSVSAGGSLAVGALLGVIGGVFSAFAGYYIRRGLVIQTKLPDFVVALVEDLLTISGGLFVVSRM
jgi:uncharacterized membrane protein